MKITSANIEHAWLHGLKDKGRASNVSFQGDDIFSYSTIMARVVVRPADPNDPGLVLVNAQKYSNTTSGHQHAIRRAIPSHWVRLNYTNTGSGYSWAPGNPGDPVECILTQWKRAKDRLRKMQHATRGDAQADGATLRNLQAAAEVLKGAKLRGIRTTNIEAFTASCPWADNAERFDHADAVAKRRSEGAQRAAETRRAEQSRLWKERQAEQAKKDAAKVDKWKAGKYSGRLSVPYGVGQYIRVKGAELETSGGASIPLDAARMVWVAWSKGKLAEGQHAGAFTIHEVTPDYFVAGCTRIDKGEALALAQAQGWA